MVCRQCGSENIIKREYFQQSPTDLKTIFLWVLLICITSGLAIIALPFALKKKNRRGLYAVCEDCGDEWEWENSRYQAFGESNGSFLENCTEKNGAVCFTDIWANKYNGTTYQVTRIERALDEPITVRVLKNGNIVNGRYRTSFYSCSCPDFQKRHLPCKHMYRLAILSGQLNYEKYGLSALSPLPGSYLGPAVDSECNVDE